MGKGSKLLKALDREKGRDYDAEKRLKQVKAAEKRKRQKTAARQSDDDDEEVPALVNGHKNGIAAVSTPIENNTLDDFEAFPDDDDSQDGEEHEEIIPQPQQDAEVSESEAEVESDVDYSDLEKEDTEDVVPHQRMTINNGPALVASRKRIAVVSDKPKMPFHHHNSLVSDDQPIDILVPDAMDDETRELMFYKIARDGAVTARSLLKKEKVPFTRPSDYFAEMVKSEEHMGKIKQKMVGEASRKKAAEESRKQRDAKKFGKQVQLAKEQERARDKRETLDRIKELKRKRKSTDTGRTTEGEDLFEEINVDSKESGNKRARTDGDRGGRDSASKRRAKDAKFGHGGKKRYSKSGTAESTADMSGFSARRMKDGARGGRGGGRGGARGGARGGSKRLGKSRRTGAR